MEATVQTGQSEDSVTESIQPSLLCLQYSVKLKTNNCLLGQRYNPHMSKDKQLLFYSKMELVLQPRIPGYALI